MKQGKRVSRVYTARIVELIQTIESVGDGSDANPARRIEQYWTKDGDLLFTKDPCAEDD